MAASLHQTIAKALDNRTVYPDARAEYERAAELFQKADGPLSQDRIVVELQRASMEARTYQTGSLPLARSIVAEQEGRIRKIRQPRPDVAVWLAAARGMIALIDNDAKLAAAQFQTAYDSAEKLPDFDRNARLNMKQKLAFANIRLGDGAKAERLIRELIEAFTSIGGPDNPSVLRVRLNLAQAFMIQNKNREAIQETNAIYPAYREKLGPDHELTMQVLATQAQCEGTLGMWPEAIRDDLAIYDIALHKQGAKSFYTIATLSDAALAQCRAGQYGAGEPNARKAYEDSAKTFGDRAGLTGGAAYTLASCWIGTGSCGMPRRFCRGSTSKRLRNSPDSLTGGRTSIWRRRRSRTARATRRAPGSICKRPRRHSRSPTRSLIRSARWRR